MLIYLAGPMRGRKFFNFPAFDAARDILMSQGYEVISPADVDRASGFDGMKCDPSDPCLTPPPGFDLDRCIAQDVAAVLKADGVCFIDTGWPCSKGARAECAVAIWRGKRLFCLVGNTLTELSHGAAETMCFHKGGLNR